MRVAALLAFVVAATSCGRTPPLGFLRPNGVAVASDGSLFVMDLGHYRVVRIAPDGRVIASFGQLGTAPADLFYGWNVALGPDDSVHVCNIVRNVGGDIVHDGVKVYSATGRFLREIGGHDYRAEETARLPYGVDVDDAGRVWVANDGTATVDVYEAAGRQIGHFFGQDQPGPRFATPSGVAVDASRGFVYVIDDTNMVLAQFRLTFDPSGQPLLSHHWTVGGFGHGPADLAFPRGLTVDRRSGVVYVSDTGNRSLAAFDTTGQFVRRIPAPRVRDWHVLGLCWGPDGSVFAADSLNDRIWRFPPGSGEAVSIGVRR